MPSAPGHRNSGGERPSRMQTLMKWLLIGASIWLGCMSAPAAARSAHRAGQTSSSSLPTTKARKSSRRHRRHTHGEPLQKAPTPGRISEIQSALSRGGYYQGDPNGKWDSNTVSAVQKFQSANGIDPTGKLDAPTLQKLGLGSDIAGVSAPRVVAPPLANLSPSPAPTSNAPSGSSSPAVKH